ncbi:murein hydrolase activator EnvC family protein [Litorivicinus lipolyticus]|uniref:murein hydrolase activator EnvC family protein n=1 Tax=Litorivicinus lipolyticus TaxID=418701 RepID=UPI003B5BA026
MRQWLLLLCLVCAPAWSADQAEQAALAAKAVDLAAEQKAERAQKAQVEAESKRLARRIERLEADLAAQNRRVDEQRGRVADFSAQRQAQADEVQGLRDSLADELNAFYRAGPEVRLALAGDNAGPRLVEYLRFLTRARRDRLDSLLTEQKRLASAERRLSDENQRLAADVARLDEEKRRLGESNARQNQMLAKLEANLSTRAARQAEVKADQARLKALLTQLPRGANQGLPFAQTKGKLEWPAAGSFIRNFGQLRADGQSKWTGLVIAAPQGGEVKAVKDGTVAYAGWLLGYGLLLVVEHDNGYATLYGHNQTLSKERGDSVRAGETIARAGATGSLTQSGVFFGVNRQGQALNPRSWLKKAG